ncbi:hypothetical protein [Legionella bononiensis]|uniref:Uncharacterized protein n=1 Tax=Legionella bononiensis TaxID=2793102 RepID=A0ABS1WBB8_9GAMM|nr:hypothetical protein [Legionella bononiensis]MBL7480193.1 hypothetical protein [Legionella bononiensis]MBL7526575.1 hypothetical protein [Legionella bononiensis]MBL7562931.1 hypothetical protein [Legionella bononiensis]
MTKNTYPEHVVYFDETIRSRISMKKEFKEERKVMRILPSNHPDNSYLNLEQQQKYVLQYSEEDYIFFADEGEQIEDGEYQFVLTCEEDPRLLYSDTLHHSALSNGKKVLAAGSLIFSDGYLEKITNNSGHYRPTDDEMLDVIKALYTATDGKLIRYKSYCTKMPLEYAVHELITLDKFADAKPLAKGEVVDLITGLRTKNNYDDNIGASSSDNNHRFGHKLRAEMSDKYENILSNSQMFFSFSSSDFNESESVEQGYTGRKLSR